MRTIVLMLLVGALVTRTAVVAARADKPTEIQAIMSKLNKPGGVYYGMVRELREETPMWDELKAQAKVLAEQTAALKKTQPPRGTKASWDALVKTYADNARLAEKAVQKMDKPAAEAILARMGKAACDKCHEAHRPK